MSKFNFKDGWPNLNVVFLSTKISPYIMKVAMFIAVYAAAARMRVYGPGNHTIRPDNYGCALSIIVELWSAGGSVRGGSCDPTAGLYDCDGGGSGGYIRARIDTDGWLSLFAYVGAPMMWFPGRTKECVNAGSWLTGGAVAAINLTIEAGRGIPDFCNTSGRILSATGATDILTHPGVDGESATTFNGAGPYATIWKAGDAPYGGRGGIFAWATTGARNATAPGGGAACCGNGSAAGGGWGGDGMLIIYY